MRPLDGLAQVVAPCIVVPDKPPGHPQLLRAHNTILRRNNACPGRNINTTGLAANTVKDDWVEHMEPLDDNDRLPISLHCPPAARRSMDKVVPRCLHRFPILQLLNNRQKHLPVDTLGRLPVRQLRWTLLQGQKEIIHA